VEMVNKVDNFRLVQITANQNSKMQRVIEVKVGKKKEDKKDTKDKNKTKTMKEGKKAQIVTFDLESAKKRKYEENPPKLVNNEQKAYDTRFQEQQETKEDIYSKEDIDEMYASISRYEDYCPKEFKKNILKEIL
jgi:hypothetical protein